MKKTIQQHINDDKDELENPSISAQRRRHIQSELYDLEKYQINHSDSDYDPNPLELYCDLNPEASECKIYED